MAIKTVKRKHVPRDEAFAVARCDGCGVRSERAILTPDDRVLCPACDPWPGRAAYEAKVAAVRGAA